MNGYRAGLLGLALATATWAGPIVNGNFEANGGSLSGWAGEKDPNTLRDPLVSDGQASGINGLGGRYDNYAVMDTTVPSPGNLYSTYTSGIYQQNVTFGGKTGTLEFKLFDVQDPLRPSNNNSGLLIDNVTIGSTGGLDTLSWDWYALTKKDQVAIRNDYYQVNFNGTTLYTFAYNSSLMPTTNSGGGGGCSYGAFSYGTGWQHGSYTPPDNPPPPVPEPATWLLLSCGLAPLVRRRRR